jgi:HEAT repeat protein
MKVFILFTLLLGGLAHSASDAVATLESLTQDLADADQGVRMRACDSLGRMGEKAGPAAMAIGGLAVNDKSPSVRQMAAQSLGEIARLTREAPGDNDEVLVRFLAKALGDPEANVRLISAQSLGYFQRNADSATMALVFVANNDGNAKVRHTAIASLGQIGRFKGPESGKAVPHLAKALSDDDPEIRRLAAYVLSLFGDASLPAMPKLIESLRDGPPQAQMEAASTLGGYGPSAITTVPLLLAKVKQEQNLQLRATAAEAAVRIDPGQLKVVVDILDEATRSKDSGVRLFALKALLEIDAKRIHIGPTLKRMQSDEIIDIQLMVARAMEDSREIPSGAENSTVLPTEGDKVAAATKVTLEDATADDADAALAILRKFLGHWEKQEFAKAELLVDERLRQGWRKQMEKRPMALRSIDDIRVFRHKETLRARVHFTSMPNQGHGLDMIFKEAKWWISGD